jgi:two-component system chemotaxis response regulator CheY
MSEPVKILAVDDEPSVTQSITFALAGPSRELKTAIDGEDALRRLEDDVPPAFDVVITDNNMPRMSGLELVGKLRAQRFTGKIVVLSAYLTDEIRQAYSALGVDEMLPKPFDISQLRSTIDRLSTAA